MKIEKNKSTNGIHNIQALYVIMVMPMCVCFRYLHRLGLSIFSYFEAPGEPFFYITNYGMQLSTNWISKWICYSCIHNTQYTIHTRIKSNLFRFFFSFFLSHFKHWALSIEHVRCLYVDDWNYFCWMLNELNAIRRRSMYYENPAIHKIIIINDAIFKKTVYLVRNRGNNQLPNAEK